MMGLYFINRFREHIGITRKFFIVQMADHTIDKFMASIIRWCGSVGKMDEKSQEPDRVFAPRYVVH